MMKEKRPKVRTLQMPYGNEVTLRKSDYDRKGWNTTVKRFGIETNPSRISYIRIIGTDEVGHLLIDVMVYE